MDKECFICLEPNNIVTNKDCVYSVKNQKFIFNCKCVTYTHQKCMQDWITHCQICPICRHKLPIYKSKITIFFNICFYVFQIICRIYVIVFCAGIFIWYTVKFEIDTRSCRDISI